MRSIPIDANIALAWNLRYIFEFEQSKCILPPNRLLLAIFQFQSIKPGTSILITFERIVGREHDSICAAEFFDAVLQGRRRKVPRGCDPDVVTKVLPDGPLTRLLQSQRLLDILKPMVDPPQVKRNMLSQMSDHHLEFGVSVKDPIDNHAQQMQAHTLCKAERRTDQPFAISPQSIIHHTRGLFGMKVEGDVEFDTSLPEHIPLRLIIKYQGLPVRGYLDVIDQCALEAVLFNAASQFRRCLGWVVHGQRRKRTKSVGLVFDLLIDIVVDLSCQRDGFLWVSHVLNSRRRVAQDVVADSIFVGIVQSDLAHVTDLANVLVGIDSEQT